MGVQRSINRNTLLFPLGGSATAPPLAFGDGDTGFRQPSDDVLAVVIGGVEALRWTELNGGIFETPVTSVGLTAGVGGTLGNALALVNSYNVVTTVASAADSVSLPAVFTVGTTIYVKNDAANAMDVFPETGDDLGEGTDTALSVSGGGSATFTATVANATWSQLIVGGSAIAESLLATNAAGPAIPDEASTSTNPTLIPNQAEMDTGIGWNSADQLAFTLGGTMYYRMTTVGIISTLANSWYLVYEAATRTNPNLIPQQGDTTSGIGAADPAGSVSEVSIITRGIELIRTTAHSSTAALRQVIISPDATLGAAATPALAMGDGDTGWWESADDVLHTVIAGVAMQTHGLNGNWFINTTTGTDETSGNSSSTSPGLVAIYGAGHSGNGQAGNVEIWGGYAAGTTSAAVGGNLILWGGSGGGNDAQGGDAMLIGGFGDIDPGCASVTGGTATDGGNGGMAQLIGGAAVASNNVGGSAVITGGLSTAGGTGAGGQVLITGGGSGAGATGTGGAIVITSGDALSSAGSGGLITIVGGLGTGTGDGGNLDLKGGQGNDRGGDVDLIGGVGVTNDGGDIDLVTGNCTAGGTSGNITLRVGTTPAGANGGFISLTGGTAGATDGDVGGAVSLIGGAAAATNGDGGDIILTPGAETGSGDAGAINITQTTAPDSTTDKLYNLAGALTWNGTDLTAGGVPASLVATNAAGPTILDVAATITVPTLVPNRADADTGIGWATVDDSLAIITGAQTAMHFSEVSSQVLWGWHTQAITADTNQDLANATQILGSYVEVVGSTDGDSVKLPALMKIDTVIEIVNLNTSGDDGGITIFPGEAGDDLGNGAGVVSRRLAQGETRRYICTTANTTWKELPSGSTETINVKGPALINRDAEDGDATILPNKALTGTGLGSEFATTMELKLVTVNALTLSLGGMYTWRSVNIAAGTTQTLAGATQITTSVVTVGTVAVNNDGVKLPIVFGAGSVVEIFNTDAAQSIFIYPASGDDLGAGTDSTVSLAFGAYARFVATAANSTWFQTD